MAADQYEYYTPGFRNIAEFEALLDEMWQDPGVRRQLTEAGAEPLLNRARSEVITLQRTGAGTDPATTTVVVVGAKILLDVWNIIILPYIQRRKGQNALKVAKKDRKRSSHEPR